MTLASDEFLASFNRIEKWLQKELHGDERFGFSELVRRASKQKISVIEEYEDDLLRLHNYEMLLFMIVFHQIL